jgi:endonuclease/exonuclease/phosphatase family metal-dependent hydrolase
MITFLFWNTNGNQIPHLVVDLAKAHAVDVLILAESNMRDADLLEQLNTPPSAQLYHLPRSQCQSIRVFTRFLPEFMIETAESDHYSVRRLSLPARDQITLAIAHLPSKLFWSEDSLAFECTQVAKLIAREEAKAGHYRTLLVGDLNMNPFEKGLIGAAGLHAVMSRDIAARVSRTVQKVDYRFFYNPMWSHFGDGGPGPPGTYFYERAEHVNYYWNIFDQVLIRPDLMNRFPNDALRILTEAAGTPLTRETGRPDQRTASDHLPILFKLDI